MSTIKSNRIAPIRTIKLNERSTVSRNRRVKLQAHCCEEEKERHLPRCEMKRKSFSAIVSVDDIRRTQHVKITAMSDIVLCHCVCGCCPSRRERDVIERSPATPSQAVRVIHIVCESGEERRNHENLISCHENFSFKWNKRDKRDLSHYSLIQFSILQYICGEFVT